MAGFFLKSLMLPWHAAIVTAANDAAMGVEAQALRRGLEWIEHQHRKISCQEFPKFWNLPGEDWELHKARMDNCFREAVYDTLDTEGRKSA